jgi:hypothetical protein
MAFVEDRWKRKEDRSRRRDSEGREPSRSIVKKADAQPSACGVTSRI